MLVIDFSNKKAFSLIEVLVSMTIISLALMALINFVFQISILSVDYTNSEKTYTTTTNIFKIITDDLTAAKKVGDCGENSKSICNFEFDNLNFKWEIITNPKYTDKYSLRKSVVDSSNNTEILFVSDPNLQISSNEIFSKTKLLKQNSTIYNTILKIQIISILDDSQNGTTNEIKKQSQILLKNYDETL